ncbi:MAG TPA: DUF1294 domain-containing protein [Peptococcaceae bacterium]|nr:DUF1294 domain-containing protein [Peptococcaceae bacterium]
MSQKYFYLLFVMVNLGGFALIGIDKAKAERRRRRIPERNFFLLGLCGGAIGVYLGMRLFRHKTKHWQFVYGIPFLILLNLGVLYFLLWR